MSRFKTELCNNLIELGSCKYGDRCHYAHGAHELRQVSRRHPKYRTEKCKNFELTGKCPFGPRCSYVHPKPDLDSMIDQLTRYMKHTKAPKPDSEDEFGDKVNLTQAIHIHDDDDVFSDNAHDHDDHDDHPVGFFVNSHRQAKSTHTSSLPTCDSLLSIDDADDENKENYPQLVVNYQVSNNTSKFISEHSLQLDRALTDSSTSSNRQQKPSLATALTINQPQTVSSQAPSSMPRTPLGSANNTRNILTTSSTTNQQINFQTNLPRQAFNQQAFNNHDESHKSMSSVSNHTASDPFGIRNPLSDYLNHTSAQSSNTLQPNKQFYTRF